MLENYKSYTYLIYFAKINSKSETTVLKELLNHKVIGEMENLIVVVQG